MADSHYMHNRNIKVWVSDRERCFVDVACSLNVFIEICPFVLYLFIYLFFFLRDILILRVVWIELKEESPLISRSFFFYLFLKYSKHHVCRLVTDFSTRFALCFEILHMTCGFQFIFQGDTYDVGYFTFCSCSESYSCLSPGYRYLSSCGTLRIFLFVSKLHNVCEIRYRVVVEYEKHAVVCRMEEMT